MQRFHDLLNNQDTINSLKASCPIGWSFAMRLKVHGEVLFRTVDKKEYSVHQGDEGSIDSTCLTFVDREGQQWMIPWEQMANIWTHLGGLD
jgi:hypothetical protein